MQLWLKHSKVTTYADDTKTCVSHKLLEKIIVMLEEDAKNVLQFMASNGLVANPKKTAFVVLYHKKDLETNPIQLNIGNELINAKTNAKLLGVTLDNNQKWKTQIQNTIRNLNSRLHLLKRLGRVISKDGMKRIMIEGTSCLQSQSFYNDAAKVWNGVPNDIKECNTLSAVKKHIRRYIQTLPI